MPEKHLTLALVVISLALVTSKAHAFTGRDLYKFCLQSPKASDADIACTSFIHGFVDGIYMGLGVAKRENLFCPPDSGIPTEQARAITEKYLRERPNELQEEAGGLVGAALILAFHCR